MELAFEQPKVPKAVRPVAAVADWEINCLRFSFRVGSFMDRGMKFFEL